VLLDIWMPDTDGITLLREWSEKGALRCPVVMLSGHGTVETAVEATRLGAFDFVEKPLSIAKLLRTVERALEAGRRRRQAQRTLIPPLVAPVGKSRLMQKLREQVQQVAAHDAAVLLVGEPGTGPELEEGMVLAVEPMVNLGSHFTKVLSDGWTVVTVDGKPSAHTEHTIAITEEGPEVLTLANSGAPLEPAVV